jgi:hypothetical protein
VIDLAGYEVRLAGRRIALTHQEPARSISTSAGSDPSSGRRDRLSRQYATLATRCEAKVEAKV